MSNYVIRGGEEGKRRLHLVASTLWPTTHTLLQQAGLQAGMRCLDMGCGGGDVTLSLAEWVGPSGHVTGVDMDATKLVLAQQDAEAAALGNIEFVVSDVYEFIGAADYDFVYARFLLTHLPDPLRALQRMVAALKPGGVIVVEDLYHGDIICHPPHRALDRHVDLYNQVVRKRGADPEIGPRSFAKPVCIRSN